MNGVSESIVRSIETLENAAAPSSLWNAMKAAAGGFGYEFMLVLKWQADASRACVPTVLYNDTLVSFADAIGHNESLQNNALVARAFAEAKPLSVREVLEAFDGLVVPIRSHDLEGLVVVLGQAPDTSAIARSALHLLAYCAFQRAIALDNQPKRKESGILSPREVECLRWAAAGKTDTEIGVILSISARTTRFHIENAKKKLGVATRIQAVAEALRLKAIAA